MNIFKLHDDPVISAQMMCDKHVVKMVTEYGQLLSTAHRILDGEQYLDRTKNGSKIKRWRLAGDAQEQLLYKASHINHPSNIWCRENDKNYRWLYKHFKNIKQTAHESVMPQCMPDHCKKPEVTEGYRNYYIKEKASFAKWSNREVPEWFQTNNLRGAV